MKKIITTVAISSLLVAGSFGQVLAHSNEDNSGKKMNGMGMMGEMDGMSGNKMGNIEGMSGMMDSEIMKQRKKLMEKIGKFLYSKGKKRLGIMKKNHMSDMMKFRKKFPGMKMTEEKKKARTEMKNKHFADLRELLKDNMELYKEVSVEMEEIMKKMQEKMHLKNGKMGSKMKGMGNMGNMKGMSGISGNKMGKMKKRLFGFKTETKINILVNKLFSRLDILEGSKKELKVKSIFNKIEKAKMKYKNISDENRKAKLNNILDYLQEKILDRSGIKFIQGNMGEMGGMNMMGTQDGEVFSNDVEGLPEAKKTEIIKLKDGDTYEMSAYAVKQEVGNRIIKRLSYNGMIPGPIIQVEKGAKIKLKFTNNLGIETTLHSHGLRPDDSKFDGLPTTMGGEQKPMQPGDSFTYELDFPDTGVFWYHPHLREDYTQEMGLYGNYSVTEKGYWSKVDKEEFMILDDFSLDDPFYKDKVNKTLMGRFGNVMMINNDENYRLNLNTGEKTRLYITNVANTRTFDFTILDNSGNKVDLKLVGGDIGRIEKEKIINNQIIAPAERYIIETVFNKAGTYIIKSRDKKLGEIIVSGKNTNENLGELKQNPDDYKIIREKFDYFLNKKADKKLRLTIGMKGMKGGMGMGGESDGDEIEWEDTMAMMNKNSNDKTMEWKLVDEENGNENMDINWKFKKGDFVKVEIYNDPSSMHPMQHPIHFHGQRFVVLSRDGVANTDLQWKDTTMVKTGEKIEILIEMTNSGVWMSHCHIAEHLQSGMMMTFRVED